MQEPWFWSLSWEDALEEGIPPVFLPRDSPWTAEPGGQSTGSQRAGHSWATKPSTALTCQSSFCFFFVMPFFFNLMFCWWSIFLPLIEEYSLMDFDSCVRRCNHDSRQDIDLWWYPQKVASCLFPVRGPYSCLSVCVHACSVAQSCLTLCNPMDCSPSGSSVHGIFQARIMQWVAISYSRRSSQPRDRTHISCISWTGRQILHHWCHFFLIFIIII